MNRIRIDHSTAYHYSEPVTLLPHKLMIRPRAGHDIQLESTSLKITPAHTVKWHRDIYGNSVAMITFLEPSNELTVVSEAVVIHYEAEPLDFLVDDKAVNFPFYFDPSERVDLIPYQSLCFPGDSAAVRDWLQQFWQPGQVKMRNAGEGHRERGVLIRSLGSSRGRTRTESMFDAQLPLAT